jgi:predicted deacylase
MQLRGSKCPRRCSFGAERALAFAAQRGGVFAQRREALAQRGESAAQRGRKVLVL